MSKVESRIGVVVIGRNEGERLKRCLRSLVEIADTMVYVDSGSTDGSVEFAESLGTHVVNLDMSKPFTMPRGRNAGFERLVEIDETLDYVQFVDGDCEVVEGWLERAREELDAREDLAAVCGRRRERYPEASIYNRLCDMEWDAPTGEVDACGGDAMMRVQAFRDSGGFQPGMIAGEEAELCVRLRHAGWKILRVDAEMTLHDAAITRFRQCWRRWVRCGHAFAEGWYLHRSEGEQFNARPVRSAIFWAGIVPACILASLILAIWFPWALVATAVLAAGYPVLALRIYRGRRARGTPAYDCRWYALHCVLGKFAELLGILTFLWNRLRGKHTGLIEYKES